jgi:secretion/DNA translocation related TadE-like protein
MERAVIEPRPVSRDRGSGTVLVLGLCALLVSGALAVGLLSAALTARHRASVAADLAALAAADALSGRRAGEPCVLAARVAQRNGGAVTQCVPDQDGSVVVEVLVRPRQGAEALGSARARARAGPAP